MAKKKNQRTSAGGKLQVLKTGSRVCCRDDGEEGRFVWADAVSVNIQWADGAQVTWNRDARTSRAIESSDAGGEAESATMGWWKPDSGMDLATDGTVAAL